MENQHIDEMEESTEFNPLFWGILFFAFWLSLRTVGQPQDLQIGLSWFFLGLSAILLISIFPIKLRELLNKRYSKKFTLPIVFYGSIFAFVLGWIGSWSSLEGSIRTISVILGFLWIVAYLLILIRITSKPMGIIVSIVFFCLAIYRFVNILILDGILSMLLGVVVLVIAIWRPKIWHKLTFG